jgi:hypothetical protein
MKYLRLYSDENGDSHFEDVEIDLRDSGRGTDVSEEREAQSVNFALFRETYGFDFHPAPRRRMVVLLTGQLELEASDGERRILGPGSILLAEDTAGKGHKSRAVGTERREACTSKYRTFSSEGFIATVLVSEPDYASSARRMPVNCQRW